MKMTALTLTVMLTFAAAALNAPAAVVGLTAATGAHVAASDDR
ncbi:hypothetical protein [Halosimplex carlsbadense]|nr:hypothetical protein [Halosimplex carlsbadense]